ncbi:hypothetical protein DENSPDRAFT_154981 [Dentipellis sp. KUC8613]|nr:hypothetical protein DENSPDRAFT_154981 [Dentipellis sp. KUC8613]
MSLIMDTHRTTNVLCCQMITLILRDVETTLSILMASNSTVSVFSMRYIRASLPRSSPSRPSKRCSTAASLSNLDSDTQALPTIRWTAPDTRGRTGEHVLSTRRRGARKLKWNQIPRGFGQVRRTRPCSGYLHVGITEARVFRFKLLGSAHISRSERIDKLSIVHITFSTSPGRFLVSVSCG